MAIRILITGGTFDKYYDAIRGEMTFSESHLPELLQQARLTIPVVREGCLLKDSLQMTDEDRELIVRACGFAPESQLVVIHGTDTMVETAVRLGHEGLKKTIVLTGAMIPYAVHGSDAEFNLGFALAAVQCLPQGVYVGMNGQVWRWDRVRKNKTLGVFEPVDAPPAPANWA